MEKDKIKSIKLCSELQIDCNSVRYCFLLNLSASGAIATWLLATVSVYLHSW